MVNKNYKRGANKERKIVKKAREEGKISFRSAGSHSPIDVCVIDYEARHVLLLQCKHTLRLKGKIPDSLKRKLISEWKFLDGMYQVSFDAV